jgi:pentatricopeptide repeat protein
LQIAKEALEQFPTVSSLHDDLIVACEQHNKLQVAEAVVKQMREKKMYPSVAAHCALLRMYSRVSFDKLRVAWQVCSIWYILRCTTCVEEVVC